MIEPEEIKSIVLDLGADKCGIAGIDRYCALTILNNGSDRVEPVR